MKSYAVSEAGRHGHGRERLPSFQPERRNRGDARFSHLLYPPGLLSYEKRGAACAPDGDEGRLRFLGEVAEPVRGKARINIKVSEGARMQKRNEMKAARTNSIAVDSCVIIRRRGCPRMKFGRRKLLSRHFQPIRHVSHTGGFPGCGEVGRV